MENYVSIQVGCSRFLDSYRLLSSSLDKVVKSSDNFPILDSNIFKDELFKKKLSLLYEYFDLDNFDKHFNLTKEDFWSTLKQETPQMKNLNVHKKLLKHMIKRTDKI